MKTECFDASLAQSPSAMGQSRFFPASPGESSSCRMARAPVQPRAVVFLVGWARGRATKGITRSMNPPIPNPQTPQHKQPPSPGAKTGLPRGQSPTPPTLNSIQNPFPKQRQTSTPTILLSIIAGLDCAGFHRSPLAALSSTLRETLHETLGRSTPPPRRRSRGLGPRRGSHRRGRRGTDHPPTRLGTARQSPEVHAAKGKVCNPVAPAPPVSSASLQPQPPNHPGR
jgi:hypothetical protein